MEIPLEVIIDHLFYFIEFSAEIGFFRESAFTTFTVFDIPKNLLRRH